MGQTNRGAGGFGSTGSMGSFNSYNSFGAFAKDINPMSSFSYMDIAKEMEQILTNNLMNNIQENSMNILDEDADIEVEDPDMMVIEPVD